MTADLAVLDERAPDIRLEVDLDNVTAVGARDQKLIVHQSMADQLVAKQ